MKFGRQLEEEMLPEFKDHYLPYQFLKKQLYDICAGRSSAVVQELTRSTSQQGRRRSMSGTPTAPSTPMTAPPTPLAQPTSPIWQAVTGQRAVQVWWDYLEQEALRIGAFVDDRLRQLVAQTQDLAQVQCERGSYVELQLLESLQRVSEGIKRLQRFVELNHAALYKIAKKHDKNRGCAEGLEEQLPRLVQASGLTEKKQRFESLEAQLREHMLQCSQCRGLEADPRVALLVASLGHAAGSLPDQSTIRGERLRFFFMGCCSALLLTIIILVALPEQEPETFDSVYFLVSFSVFRVVWSILLMLWCMGAVARVCDDNFINHRFILSVDLRCRANANYLFGRAAILSSLWILFLGMYVLDYKWMLFPTVVQKREWNYRSSWHFVLYPLLLLLLTLFMMLYPSRTCRFTYKGQVLGCIGRTCLAPLYAVSFADNLVGDVMTSLAKPLEDIPAAFCYLVSHHPQQPEDVRAFIENGDACPRWVHFTVMPLLAAAPFVFRLLQCARRYRDTKESKHLLNLGKYCSSLLVLVVTRTWKEGTAVIVVSVIATAYAAVWDVRMDWGLDCPGPRSIRAAAAAEHPGGASGNAREITVDPLLAGRDAEAPGERPRSGEPRLEVSASFAGSALGPASPRPVGGVVNEKRHFSPLTYFIAACLDVALRMTWVLTLIPVTLISNNIVQRAVLTTSTATLEILRRSMWTVLRIENEQVNNASGFRALHWVPQRLSLPSQIPTCQTDCKMSSIGEQQPASD